jgi:aconitate hydratase
MARAASIVRQAVAHGITPKAEFGINPGSEQIRYTIERDGIIAISKKWELKYLPMLADHVSDNGIEKEQIKQEKNTIVHSFNRNFSKRADGNPNTHAFVTSPEMVAALAISGRLDFNPINRYFIK